MIAGLEDVSGGTIAIDGRIVNEIEPKDRDIAMVFQDYALYPHMTVYENMAFGLIYRGTPKADIRARVEAAAETLDIAAYLKRRPRQLSGGQRQRVAMGRAIVREPKVFLMDEPLSNLDAKLRVSMRGELARLHDRLGVTTIYVTHDQIEAMTLGQRVAVLRDGVLQQVDTPQTLFRRPANLFVAAFIGSPSMNLVEADVGNGFVRFADIELPLPSGRDVPAGRLIVGIRPTDFAHGASADPALPRLVVRPEVVEDLGSEAHVTFPVDAPRVVAEAVQAAVDDPADDEGALFADDQRSLFTARVDGEVSIRPGSAVELAIDTNRMHFFDAATGDVVGVGHAAPTPVGVGHAAPTPVAH